MSSRSLRANALRPDYFIKLVEQLMRNGKIKDELCIRRLISALYFTLFNFWAAVKYDKGIREKGPKQDRFDYSEFHNDLKEQEITKPNVVPLINSVARCDLNVEADKANRRTFWYIELKNEGFVRIIHKI